jgi:hypothetical protein
MLVAFSGTRSLTLATQVSAGALPGGFAVLLVPLRWPGDALLRVPQVAFDVILRGAHYAATDGVLLALASGVLPEATRANRLAGRRHVP